MNRKMVDKKEIEKLNELEIKISELKIEKKALKRKVEEAKYEGSIEFPIILEYTSNGTLMRYNQHLKYDFPPYTTLGLVLGHYQKHPYVNMIPPDLTMGQGITINLGNVVKPDYKNYHIKIIIEPIPNEPEKQQNRVG